MSVYFRFQQTANLITVDDAFAELIAVRPNGDMHFQFTFTVSPGEAITRNAHAVKVTASARYVSQKPLLGNTSRGNIDTAALVDNIRSLLPDAKTSVAQRTKYTVSATTNGVLSQVNKQVLPMLQAKVPARNIPQLNTPQLVLVPASQVKQTNNAQPVLARVANSFLVPSIVTTLTASTNLDPSRVGQDMVARTGLDPSYIATLTPRSQTELQSRGGLLTSVKAVELPTDGASLLANFHLFPPQSAPPPKTTDELLDTELVQILQTTTAATVEMPVDMVLPAAKLRLEGADLTNIFVQFDLVEASSDEPIDTVIKTLNLARELQIFHTPTVPPVIKVAVNPGRSLASLRIRQVDPGATAVALYKKVLFAATVDVDEYTLVGTYNLTAQQQALQVQVDMPVASAAIYRAVPIGAQGAQGFEFSSVVVKPPHYTPIRAISLVGSQVPTGFQIELRNIPPQVVAVQFLRWNLSTHDSTYTTVNGDVGFVDAATRAANIMSLVDTNVQSMNVYRYVARLIYMNGITEDAGDAILEFVQPSPGEVSTTVTNLVVNHDTVPDVTFTINTVTSNTDMDTIKQLLGNQDLRQYFQGDIQNQRNQLANLIAHSVQRVDLTTGLREDFGTVTTNVFSDSASRKNRAVQPLQYGHAYRYEIYPLLRAPETMFSDLAKDATDDVTRKSYTFSPAKFFHPLALSRGILVSSKGANQLYAKDPMSFGVVGDVTTVEASFDKDTAKVAGQSATRFSRVLNVITWQVQGDIAQVDHFLVMKLVNGVRTMIGKAHSEFPYGACQYFHPVTRQDDGAMSYVIVPVMNDYKVGPAAITNSVKVDAP